MRLFTKKILNSKIKRIILLILLLFFYILFSAVTYTNAVCSDISNTVFRLHVIANSDSEEDQILKYIVRDAIIDYINTISQNATTKEDIIKVAQNNINEVKSIAQQTIYDNGYNYSVDVKIGNFAFPTKKYGDISLPAGYYDALKIEIGKASGQNWWCVMFPPLCFVDVTSGIVPDDSKEFLKSNLSKEEYNLISNTSPNIKLKFKLVEVLQNFIISDIFM